MFTFVWIGFLVFILCMLALDLGVFHRRAHAIRTREALAWTCVWIALALVFNVLVYFLYEHHWLGFGAWHAVQQIDGREAALQFFTGYLLEESLSVDNLFVIALIFAYFQIPLHQQHRVLFWGILGALIFRGVMIGLGAALISRFEWITYVFGVILLFTAGKMAVAGTDHVHPERNVLVRMARRFYPVVTDLENPHFFVRVDNRRAVTTLFLALLLIESTDVLFAVDSIPAIFSVTKDPFIVFTSNVFAILGLRSLYFALAGMMQQFRYLKASLVFVLAFIGVKMLIEGYYHIDTSISLIVIGVALALGVVTSLIAPPNEPASQGPSNHPNEDH